MNVCFFLRGAGEVLGQLCRSCGANVFLGLQEVVIDGIQFNLDREFSTSSSASDDHGTSSQDQGVSGSSPVLSGGGGEGAREQERVS